MLFQHRRILFHHRFVSFLKIEEVRNAKLHDKPIRFSLVRSISHQIDFILGSRLPKKTPHRLMLIEREETNP